MATIVNIEWQEQVNIYQSGTGSILPWRQMLD
jgi:hypothetical protein